MRISYGFSGRYGNFDKNSKISSLQQTNFNGINGVERGTHGPHMASKFFSEFFKGVFCTCPFRNQNLSKRKGCKNAVPDQ